MKKIIIINGPTAVGKSTTIALLRQKLKNYVFVDRAYIKQMLRPLSKELRRELSNYVSLFLIKQAMKEKKNVLTQEMSSEVLKKAVQKYGYIIKEFSLTCSLFTSLKRDKERGGKTTVGTIKEIHKKFETKVNNTPFTINTERYTPKEIQKIILTEIRKTYKHY